MKEKSKRWKNRSRWFAYLHINN